MRQADYVEKFYTLLFSHPAVEAITWWDLADGKGAYLEAPAGLVRADMSPKPAYTRLLQFIKKTWWTVADTVTDHDGYAMFDGFHGRYQITTSVGEKTTMSEFALTREGKHSLTIAV